MLKKIIAGAAGAGLVLTMASSALAHHWWRSDDDITVNNRAVVTNRTLTVANTGLNFGGSRRTGDATAVTAILNDVNYTAVDCGCVDGDITVNNGAAVTNGTITVANTGLNFGGHHHHRGGRGGTGDAIASAAVTNLVNTTIIGGID